MAMEPAKSKAIMLREIFMASPLNVEGLSEDDSLISHAPEDFKMSRHKVT